MQVHKDTDGVRKYLAKQSILVVPKIMGTRVGDIVAFGQMRTDRFDKLAPARPQNLQATAMHNAVTLTWNEPGDSSISGYQILRRNRDVDPVGEFTAIVDNTGSAATSYVDNTVAAGGSYVYRVKARNAGGLSQLASYARADIPSTPDTPTAPPFNVRLNGTPCHLVDAISAANTDMARGDCPTGSGADTITLTGNVTLAASIPDITSEISIAGGRVRRDRGSSRRPVA